MNLLKTGKDAYLTDLLEAGYSIRETRGGFAVMRTRGKVIDYIGLRPDLFGDSGAIRLCGVDYNKPTIIDRRQAWSEKR